MRFTRYLVKHVYVDSPGRNVVTYFFNDNNKIQEIEKNELDDYTTFALTTREEAENVLDVIVSAWTDRYGFPYDKDSESTLTIEHEKIIMI